MSTEDKLRQELQEAQDALKRAQKKLKELENSKKHGWWKPEKNDYYYYISDGSCIYQDMNIDVETDHIRIENLNCFKTEEEAELEQLQSIIRRKIQDIALRLNRGRKIDWTNTAELKYFVNIIFPSIGKYVITTRRATNETPLFDRAYCLDKNFGRVTSIELKNDIERYCELQRKVAETQQ